MTSPLPALCEDENRSAVIDFGRYAMAQFGVDADAREELSETCAQLVKYAETGERPDPVRVAALCDCMYALCIAKHKAAGGCDPVDRLMLDRARWLSSLTPGPMPHWVYPSVRQSAFAVDVNFADLERWRTYVFGAACDCGQTWCVAVLTPIWSEGIARRSAAVALPNHDCGGVTRIGAMHSTLGTSGTATEQAMLAAEMLRRMAARGAEPIGPVFLSPNWDQVTA